MDRRKNLIFKYRLLGVTTKKSPKVQESACDAIFLVHFLE